MRFVLTTAGASMLVLFSMVFVLSDQASANDGPSCGTTAGFIPKFCLPIPPAATVRRDTPVPANIAALPTVTVLSTVTTPSADDTLRTDVVIGAGSSAFDALSVETSSAPAIDIPSEYEPDVAEEPSLARVFDIDDLRAYARDAALRQGIDPVLFVRQMTAESDFDPNAVSRAGAVGIAQIMPALHPAVDPTDPYASLDYAARLMRGYINHFGDWRRALIAYNAGPGRLTPGNPHYLPQATLLSDAFAGGETKRYVARILGR
jgi:hypothetical protein